MLGFLRRPARHGSNARAGDNAGEFLPVDAIDEKTRKNSDLSGFGDNVRASLEQSINTEDTEGAFGPFRER